MKPLPDDVKTYKRTPLFTHETVPLGFFKNHNTKTNVWVVIQIMEGNLEYTIGEDEIHILEPGKNGVVEPTVLHRIKPLGAVLFFLEFYK